MKRRYTLILPLLSLVLTGCQPDSIQQNETENSINAESSIADFAKNIEVKYEIITNRSDDNCDPNVVDGLCFQAQIRLTSPVSFNDKDWKIYFSNMGPIQQESSEEFDITHVNGDMHTITPSQSYTGFIAGQTYTIPFRGAFWHLAQTDMMPNYYIVGSDQTPHVLLSTKPQQDAETGLEILPYSIPLTEQDHHFKRTEADNTQPATANWLYKENQANYVTRDVTTSILPTPKSVIVDSTDKSLDLKSGLKINLVGISQEGIAAALSRLKLLGISQSTTGINVTIKNQPGLEGEAYELIINESEINIEAGSDTGAFYALQSLSSLITPESTVVPLLTVKDEPRFDFRGMHVDVSRNFKSKEFILKVLEQMAAYKLNKFHFHLADDEGWRVEIPGLPELTDIGGYRCHDLTEQNCLLPQLGSGPNRDSHVNGYYTVEDYKEILAFATARHIQVIPSMDMPGHSRAAIKAMAARHNKLMSQGKTQLANQYVLHDVEDSTVYSSVQFYNDNTINACMDSSYDFIGKVVDELTNMHEQAKNKLTRYHIGADETAGAWLESTACKKLLKDNVTGIESAEDIAAYFVERVSRLLAKRGIEAAGWNDGMGHTKKERMPEVVQSNAWTPLMWGGHKAAHEQVNRGWEVVISTPETLYFDFPYEADSKERGYYWASRHINSHKVFNFMPENLPANAEFMKDREENAFVSDDTVQTNDKGEITHKPMEKGKGFVGMQGQFWSESVRTDDQASYMIFPRLYALAERAWHKADWELDYDYDGKKYSQDTSYITDEMYKNRDLDWQRFSNHIATKTLYKAELSDLYYRLPTVGAVIENGVLRANTTFVGVLIEYKDADTGWTKYTGEVEVNTPVFVRTISINGRRKGRALAVN
ncbi:family 20 glycosylhydrolase [uncultured Psychrosphaera sp.]|uniref:family 20 glycosylhydrolase n=1 Tax=uncultured Psychrosphaera sp. TaxID=1403522 RepID=UPI0030FA743C